MTFTFKHGDRPLDGYTVQRGVGRGGFGEVYYALSDSGKEVALKYLRDNPQVELRGVSHCMNLKSPHLVTVYDIKQNAAGEYFIIMEYVSGPSLRDLLIAEGEKGLGAQKAAFFLREIAKGLGYLHDRGIVHRDLKPGNIFYEDGYVKIGDYGLSKFISVSQHSVQTASVGTVHYMAPEVGTGNYHRGIDIYALGVILFEMLLGRVPYEGSSMGEVLMKHLTAQPEVDQLPAPFADVIRKALAKDPKERYQTVDEMVESVFGVDDIRDSVARFEPTSVSMAAARAVPAQVAAGVGGSSGEVNLPPRGADAWGRAAADGSGSSGQDASWGDRMRDRARQAAEAAWSEQVRREPRGDRIRDRLSDVESRLRNIEGVQPNAIPRFPPRSRWVAGILGVFLGWIGVHRFYLGYTRVGIIQIVLTMISGGTAGIWGFVEGILILAGVWGQDVYGRPVVSRKPTPPVLLDTRWLERLLVAVLVAIALSAGVAMVSGTGVASSGDRAEDFMNAFAFVLTFVAAMTVAAMLSSLIALRIHSVPAPPMLGRLVVFGMGLLALLAAAAFCREVFPPTGSFASAQAHTRAVQQYDRMLEAVVAGLAVAMLLVSWAKLLKRGTEGRVELGSAVWAGIVAGVASLFWSENYFVIAGGIAATTSLTVQSAAFFRLRRPGDRAGGPPDGPSGSVRYQTTPPDQEPAHANVSGGQASFPSSSAGETPPPPDGSPSAQAMADAAGPVPVHKAHFALSERSCTERARRAWGMIFAGILAVPVVLVLGSLLDVPEDHMPFSVLVGVACAVLFVWSSCWVSQWRRARRAAGIQGASCNSANAEDSPCPVGQQTQPRAASPSDFILRSPAAILNAPELPLRSGAARIFWGVVAAAALCGAMMCLIAVMTLRLSNDEAAGCMAGCLGLLAFEVFPLSKLTRRRRWGVYREWLRPLFIAICLAAAGIAAGVLGWMQLHEDEAFVAICFLVIGLVFALFFTLVRGSGVALEMPTADQAAQSSDRSRRLKTGLAILIVVIVLLGILLVDTRPTVHLGDTGYTRYESTESGGLLASREAAYEACAQKVVGRLQGLDLVDWRSGPFRLIVNARTNMDPAARKQWEAAFLGALRAAYPHAGPYDLQIGWEQRQTAVGAHWNGEGVGENEAVFDLGEQEASTGSQTSINARLLAKARGALNTISIRYSYEREPRKSGR